MSVRAAKLLLYGASAALLVAAGVTLHDVSGASLAGADEMIDSAALEPVRLSQEEKAGALDHARLEAARLSRRPVRAPSAARPRVTKPPLSSRIRVVAIVGRTAVLEDRRTKKQEAVPVGGRAFGIKVVAIGRDSVTLEEGGKRVVLGRNGG